MLLKGLFLGLSALSFGLLSSAGVFTVLASVGLIPRFAGKMHVANKVFALEEAVIFGTLIGGFFSIYKEWGQIGKLVQTKLLFGTHTAEIWNILGNLLLITGGLFAGIFVGCLAFAIAEMLDSIPIFARRIGFRHGLGVAITAAALGKAVGSMLYFAYGIFISGG